jgi:hypothetical protein
MNFWAVEIEGRGTVYVQQGGKKITRYGVETRIDHFPENPRWHELVFNSEPPNGENVIMRYWDGKMWAIVEGQK